MTRTRPYRGIRRRIACCQPLQRHVGPISSAQRQITSNKIQPTLPGHAVHCWEGVALLFGASLLSVSAVALGKGGGLWGCSAVDSAAKPFENEGACRESEQAFHLL